MFLYCKWMNVKCCMRNTKPQKCLIKALIHKHTKFCLLWKTKEWVSSLSEGVHCTLVRIGCIFECLWLTAGLNVANSIEALNTDINSTLDELIQLKGIKWTVRLQQDAFVALLALPGLQRRPGGHLEHLPHAVLGFGRALHVSEGTDAVGHVSALLGFDGLLRDGRCRSREKNTVCTRNQRQWKPSSGCNAAARARTRSCLNWTFWNPIQETPWITERLYMTG